MSMPKNEPKAVITRADLGVDCTGVPTLPECVLRAIQHRGDDGLTAHEVEQADIAIAEAMTIIRERKVSLLRSLTKTAAVQRKAKR